MSFYARAKTLKVLLSLNYHKKTKSESYSISFDVEEKLNKN